MKYYVKKGLEHVVVVNFMYIDSPLPLQSLDNSNMKRALSDNKYEIHMTIHPIVISTMERYNTIPEDCFSAWL